MAYCQCLWHRTVRDVKQRTYCVYFFRNVLLISYIKIRSPDDDQFCLPNKIKVLMVLISWDIFQIVSLVTENCSTDRFKNSPSKVLVCPVFEYHQNFNFIGKAKLIVVGTSNFYIRYEKHVSEPLTHQSLDLNLKLLWI
jgi:hypothetical protein